MESDFMEKWKKDREATRNEEKRAFLVISDADALNLPIPDQYQRMRYQREVYAHEWLMELRRKNPIRAAQPVKRRYASSKGNIIQFRNQNEQ